MCQEKGLYILSESKRNNDSRVAQAVTSAAFVSIFIYSLVVSMPGILINEVVYAFSLDGTEEGLMGALVSFGFVISIFFTIMTQGRAKKTVVLCMAFAVQAVMLFVSGFSPTFILFSVGCALIGFSGGFIDTVTNSLVVDARKKESAKYLGYLHGFFGVGSLLSPLIFTWALRHIDWRGIHYVLAVASVLVVVIILLLTRGSETKSEKIAVREHLFTKQDLLAYFKLKRNIALNLAGFFAMLTIAGVMIWIVRYMTLRHDAAELGALSITVYWICATLTRFVSAPIIKRAPMKFFALGGLLSGIFILIGVLSGNPVVLLIMLGIFGFCSGHFIPVLVSECALGYEGRTTFTTSVLMFVMGIARIVAPIIMAFLGTQISLTFGMMLPVATAICTMTFGWMAYSTNKAQ